MDKILDVLNVKLMIANKNRELIRDYRKLQTDEERIIFTFNVMLNYGVIPQEYNNGKNEKESEKLRAEGNKKFASTPFTNSICEACLELYTKSIAYAPYPSKQLALAFGNRSAVLIKLHKYEECINDIDRAFKLPYPDNLRTKLFVRKAECLVASRNPNAHETIKEAQLQVEQLPLNDVNRRKLAEKLAAIRKLSMSQITEEQCKIEHGPNRPLRWPLPTLKRENPEVPCASDALAIRYDKCYGRHIVATRKINPGEIITIEKCYSLFLTPSNLYTHCSHCLEVSWANIPCENCPYAMYCSEECKSADWVKYHDIECVVFPSLINLKFNKLDLFSLRLAVQAVRECKDIQELRTELEEVDSWKDPRTKGFSKNGIFESDKCRSVLSLVTNTEKRTPQNLFRRSLDSCFITYFLATRTSIFGHPIDRDLIKLMKNNDVTFIGGLLLRYQQTIPSNAHSHTEERGLDLSDRGCALMPFLSLINHSCDPNITRHSRPKHMILYSLYPIEKGEQIFDNYGQHYALLPKEERQKVLLSQYYFSCSCIACKEDWPLQFGVKSWTTRVKKEKCENKKVHEMLSKFGQYVDIAVKGTVTDDASVVNDLLQMIEIFYDNVTLPCSELNYVTETLKRIYGLYGNTYELPEL